MINNVISLNILITKQYTTFCKYIKNVKTHIESVKQHKTQHIKYKLLISQKK